MHPDIGQRVLQRQQKQAESHNAHAKDRTLRVGDTVFVMNFSGKTKWLHGVIVEQTGPVSFRIRLEDGRVVRRHIDHVRSRRVNDEEEEESSVPEKTLSPELPPEVPIQEDQPASDAQAQPHDAHAPPSDTHASPSDDANATPSDVRSDVPPTQLRRSERTRKPPERLNL